MSGDMMKTAKGKSCIEDPGRVRELATAIAVKELSPVDLVQRYLDRIDVVQPIAEPWREIDGARALAVAEERAEEAARGIIRGPLHGIPFGVKDIIDVEGLPTRCNCKAMEDIAPSTADAEVVLSMKAAGAIVLGKVHNTEFALRDPSPARNPHNTDYTPGGSSSGSAAAVASGTVPVALGTQTHASVNRPAAYCGVAAFKPSTRSLSTYGVAPLAPSFDTIGFYGWSVDDAVYAYEAAAPSSVEFENPPDAQEKPRIVTIDDPLIADAEPDMVKAFTAQADRFRAAGYAVEERPSPFPFERIDVLHWNNLIYEAGRALAHLLDLSENLVGRLLRKALVEGQSIPMRQYLDDRAELDQLRAEFFAAFETSDAFFWPAAPGPATEGLETTGDPKYIAPWTVLGGPIVTMPSGEDSNGLPLGCILSSRPGTDRRVGELARRLSEC